MASVLWQKAVSPTVMSSKKVKALKGPLKTFTWQIENISFYIIGRNKYLRSPSFTHPSGEELEFEIFTGIFENSEFSLSLRNKRSLLGSPIMQKYPANLYVLTKSGHDQTYASQNGNPIYGIKAHLFQTDDKLVFQCDMCNDVPEKCFARTVFLRDDFLWILPRADFTNNARRFQLGPAEFFIRINDYDSDGDVCAKLEQVQDSGTTFRFPLCKISVADVGGSSPIAICEEYFISEPWSFRIKMRNEFVVNDMLLLEWEFVIALEEKSDVEFSSPYNVEEDELNFKGATRNSLASDLLHLYKDSKMCDAVLKTEETSFPVHKNILSARSPVFSAMFERDMEEGRTGEVVIEDIDKETLDRMLVFIYSGTLTAPHPTLGDLNWDAAYNLYYAADKYAILHMKDQCRSVLVSELSVRNVCDGLCLADQHQDDQLMKSASTFLWDNHNRVMSSWKWKDMEKKKPDLVAQLLNDMEIKRRR